MKVYKLEVLIIDYDVNSVDEALNIINETRYANHTNVEAITCREADIGEWSDDNPLNYTSKVEKEMNRLFPGVKND
jgi:hypothetical protein